MEIRYRYSLLDLIRFNAYCIGRQRGLPVVAATVTIVLALLIATAPPQEGHEAAPSLLHTTLLLGASLAFISFGTLTFVVLSSLLRGRRQLSATNTLQITSQGIAIDSEIDSSETPWQHIAAIEESRHFVVFFIDHRVAFMIPTSSFSTRYEQQCFIERARNYQLDSGTP